MLERKPQVNSTEVETAIPRMKELYALGWSTVAIGEELNLSKETVRRKLIAEGVEIRSNGRPRAPGPRKAVLSPEEVERLRTVVGFVPENQPKRKRRGWELRDQ